MSKKAWAKLIAIAAAVILFVILVWQNAGTTAALSFLVVKGEMPLILLMVILFGLGFIAGIFTAFKITAKEERKKQ